MMKLWLILGALLATPARAGIKDVMHDVLAEDFGASGTSGVSGEVSQGQAEVTTEGNAAEAPAEPATAVEAPADASHGAAEPTDEPAAVCAAASSRADERVVEATYWRRGRPLPTQHHVFPSVYHDGMGRRFLLMRYQQTRGESLLCEVVEAHDSAWEIIYQASYATMQTKKVAECMVIEMYWQDLNVDFIGQGVQLIAERVEDDDVYLRRQVSNWPAFMWNAKIDDAYDASDIGKLEDLEPKVVRALKVSGAFQEESEEYVAHVIMTPEPCFLSFGCVKWIDEARAARVAFTHYRLSHRSFAGGLLGFVKKEFAGLDGLMLEMLSKAYEDRLAPATIQKLLANKMFQVDHVLAAVGDDLLNFYLMFKTLNGAFGYQSHFNLKKELVGEEAWAAAEVLVQKSTAVLALYAA